jgi:hypothetical protein
VDQTFGIRICISVRDTGTGITEEVLQSAVEPFFTTKDVGKGAYVAGSPPFTKQKNRAKIGRPLSGATSTGTSYRFVLFVEGFEQQVGQRL